MCGIVAVLASPSRRAAPDLSRLVAEATRASGEEDLAGATTSLRKIDSELRGPVGLRALLSDRSRAKELGDTLDELATRAERIEADFDSGRSSGRKGEALIGLKDALWSLRHDRLGMAGRVASMIGDPVGAETNLDGWWAIEVALSSLDRLEVRGRDSAGLHVLVVGHGLDPADPEVAQLRLGRQGGLSYPSCSVRFFEAGAVASFVYKAAAEVGELGDNVKALRAAISSDPLLSPAIEHRGARVTVVAHTRWASVGIISEPNAHPVNSDEVDRPSSPYVVAALNGDVDNHMELRQTESLSLPAAVTTDAKVIPAMISRRLAEGQQAEDAFLDTVTRFEGSVAIAASVASTPDQLQLALSGSGQALYVGLADGAFVVASEPYGLVEETDRYVRMDGESSRGEVVVLQREGAGTLEGMKRIRYSGHPTPLSEEDISVAEITTRDVDRRGFDHFLLKEITEAPSSFLKTLRGRIVPGPDGTLTAQLGDDVVPPGLVSAAGSGALKRVFVIGQGTAAVAGQAVAAAVRKFLTDLTVVAMPATELSGFGFNDDMSDTLVVAISQSGTTTDTNRTVDLARTRGAHIVSIVNRRNSDLATKSHGVLHTSDGRDVEMSVASTKAFYAQVAAGWLLAVALAEAAGVNETAERHRILSALRNLPTAMEEVLLQREEIGRIASAVVPSRRYWAVVGSGPDHIAAQEVRIKLSELCYRSISADTTEDKKHIDLSCEPFVLVCAAGLSGSNADDAAKEVAIYRAHKAAPVVIAAEGETERFRPADVITVPATEPELAFVLAAMAGHLFGYEAALSIDAQARMLRSVRGVIEEAISAGTEDRLAARIGEASRPFFAGMREGSFDGNLEASVAVRLVSLLQYATGSLPLEGYESESGKIGTPQALLSDLLDALTEAIDELTRPIDAIRHQAKTVTVGISRSEEALFGTALVQATLGAGAAPDTLGYRALRTLSALDPGVAEVLGFTRYRIEWTPPNPTAAVVDQGGIARNLRSRTGTDPRLRGSKHRAAEEREVTVVRGANDGRTVILVPEVKGQQVTGMTLLHVLFHERLPADRARAVLSGYRTRYSALTDAVTETEHSFDDARLGEEPLVELLTKPVWELARRWRTAAG